MRMTKHDQEVLARIEEIIHELEGHDLKVVMYNAYQDCMEGEDLE